MIHRFHRLVLRHTQDWVQVTVPMWDRSSRGYLVKCECGKVWAL